MARRKRQSPENRLLQQVVRNYQHSAERLGKLLVQCEVSDRFLTFPETSALLKDGRDLLSVDVMTRNVDGDVRKLCFLIIDRTDLLQALTRVKPRPFGGRSPEND